METKDLLFGYEGLDHYPGFKKKKFFLGILLAAVVDDALVERAEKFYVTLCLGKSVRLDVLEMVVKQRYQILPT